MTTRHPYMPLYVLDYDADTKHLTAEEDGVYGRLLRAMWHAGGRLPGDEKTLANIARLPRWRWRKLAPTIIAFFTQVDGDLEHKRINKELKRIAAVSEARSKAAKAKRSKNPVASRTKIPVDGSAAKSLKSGQAPDANAPHTRVTSDFISSSLRSEETPLASLTGPPPTEQAQSELSVDAPEEEFRLTPPAAKGKQTKVAPIARFGSEFNEFWHLFPNKVGKADARRKFDIARRKVELDALLEGVGRYIVEKPADRPWVNPSTWLHQERWEDEPAPTPAARSPPNGAASRPAAEDDYSDENMRRIGERIEARRGAGKTSDQH
jgi:uncharacterized protein YdaU (DUF1376 family)